MGNATAAAREVFNIESDAYAGKKGSEMVRKSKVKELIDEALTIQRENHRKFLEQAPYYLHVIARKLVQIIEDDKTTFDNCMIACDKLARFAGRDLSEEVAIAKIKAETMRPLPTDTPQPLNNESFRKVLFMLHPPAIQKGGVPPPALVQQWREQGVPEHVLEQWQREGVPEQAEQVKL
jgi:hypothetical protein